MNKRTRSSRDLQRIRDYLRVRLAREINRSRIPALTVRRYADTIETLYPRRRYYLGGVGAGAGELVFTPVDAESRERCIQREFPCLTLVGA